MIFIHIFIILKGANDAVATSSEVLAEREHVQAASSSSMASSSSAAAPEEVQEVRSSSSSASVESVDSSSADLDVSAEDDITVVWENPNKIKRSLPLRLKAHDPAQCTDILDSMYELYYENEVRLSVNMT